MRFIVQEILSGDFVTWDLPLSNAAITFSLSGPTVITGSLAPSIMGPNSLGLDAWAHWIHVEEAGEIRASGILQPMAIEGEVLSIDAEGASGYPHGIPYLGEFNLGSPIGVGIDPLDVVRHIWDHLQIQPEGNLGVEVDTTTSPIRIGTPKEEVSFETGAGEQVDFVAGPYTLDWWETTDCGAEINALATETPFDYRDRASWNDSKTDVLHRIELGYPRIGRKQTNLSFVQDENLKQVTPLYEPSDHYASQVVVRGKGEGRDSVRGYAGRRLLERVRRVSVVDDRSIASVTRANAIANDELRRRQVLSAISDIVVDANHQNAQMGTFAPGDDIFIKATIPWVGDVALWHRILTMKWMPDTNEVSCTLARSESFVYGVAP